MKTKRKMEQRKSERRMPMAVFWGVVLSSFVGLFVYRMGVKAPIWFDEIVMKAVIFGLPFLYFAWVSARGNEFFGLGRGRFMGGAYLGLALGGVFGFCALLASTIMNGKVLVPNLIGSGEFWWAFLLALATGWWESLFFYGLVGGVLLKIMKSKWRAIVFTAVIFILFHLPNVLLRANNVPVASLFFLFLFACGQAVMYLRYKSVVMIAISQAFWGMALLVYTIR